MLRHRGWACLAFFGLWSCGIAAGAAADSEAIGDRGHWGQEEVMLLEEGAAPVPQRGHSAGGNARGKPAPTWKTMSAADKAMSARQAEASHFLGAMTTKERGFARQQGAEKELFGMNGKEQKLAQSQAASDTLDASGKHTLRYLTTPERFTSQDLLGLDNIRKQASKKAAALRKELAELKARTARRSRTLGETMSTIHDAIAENEEESQDLGEDASVGKHERVVKAQSKAKIEMTALAKRHRAAIKVFRREMKETIAKSNKIRMEADRKAQQVVPRAIKEYDAKWSQKKRAAEKKRVTLREAAMAAFRRSEAQVLKDKQAADLRFSSKKNEWVTESNRVSMNAKARFLKEAALYQSNKAKMIAIAQKYGVQARTQMLEQERRNRERGLAQGKAMKSKFDAMKAQIYKRTKNAISKLKNTEKKTIDSAKKALDKANRKGKEAITLARNKKMQTKKHASIEMGESKEAHKREGNEKDNQLTMKLDARSKNRSLAKLTKEKIKKQKALVSKFNLRAKKKRSEIEHKAKVREKAMARKGTLSDADYKKRQLAWLGVVKKDAMKTCHDAKREAILKSRAASLTNSRLSRMSQDMATMKDNVLADVKAKGAKMLSNKERGAKKLKKVIVSQAKAMQTSPKSYDAAAVQKAAQAFSKVSIPAASASSALQKAKKAALAAKNTAKKQTKGWAKKKASEMAHQLKNNSQKVCDEEQHKYQLARYRVRKRLGLANESDHKAVIKKKFKAKRWALGKVSVLLGRGKKISEASVKKQNKLSQAENLAEKKRERKLKQKVNDSKRKQKLFAVKAKRAEAKAKAELKRSAAQTKLKISEAQKLMKLAAKAYRTQSAAARKQTTSSTSKLQKQKRKEEHDLGERRRQAMSVLAKTGKSNAKGGFAQAKKKVKEQIAKASQKEKELVQKAKTRRDDTIRKKKLSAKQKLSQFKLKTQNAKSAADKRALKAKLVLSRKKEEAKTILAELMKQRGGRKQEVVYQAKLKAQRLLTKGRKIATKAMKDARKMFIGKVKRETKKYLGAIKASQTKISSAFNSEGMEQDLGESADTTSVAMVRHQGSSSIENARLHANLADTHLLKHIALSLLELWQTREASNVRQND